MQERPDQPLSSDSVETRVLVVPPPILTAPIAAPAMAGQAAPHLPMPPPFFAPPMAPATLSYATGGYNLPPPRKPRHPAVGFIRLSLVIGLIALTVLFFTWYYLSRQEEKFLRSQGLYVSWVFATFAYAALLLMMLVGVSGLSTLARWSRPVLLVYAILMFLMQIFRIFLSAAIRQQMADISGEPIEDISPAAIFGYSVFALHTI